MNIPTSYSIRPNTLKRLNGFGTLRSKPLCNQDPKINPLEHPVECVSAAVEETLVRLKTNPSYGLKEFILDHARISNSDKLQYEVRLVNGRRLIIFIGSNKRRLNKLVSRARRLRRTFVDKILINIGESVSRVLSKIANSIRAVCYTLKYAPDCDFDAEQARRQARQRKAKWTTPKNFQQQFA